ncbi:hypothetical protein HPP92_018527 [Vanilla planifolia]|uniref:DNA-3-methyladenine glycosylase I n=1 Tax=Vanilla planifolia TaxID=51239 RepID=A0A835QGK5_VANPL|nr:hypothetical protein HPP92_018527 [Vanilla planifolia]
MPTPSNTRLAMKRGPNYLNLDWRTQTKALPLRHLKRVHPLGINRSSSSCLSFSTLSSSQNSNDSSLDSSISSWDHKLPHSVRKLLGSWVKREDRMLDGKSDTTDFESWKRKDELVDFGRDNLLLCGEAASLKRCSWITKNSDESYVSFHDECWGVPVYNDSRLYELLSMCGMLIDHNWTEILKRRELYRDAFAKFDFDAVAEMGEKDIMMLSSHKELLLTESRIRCIIDNAKCIQEVTKEFGSFTEYMWGQVTHKPVVNRYKYSRKVPLRTPKAEAISKDMVRRGFRLVGPVIVYSFMQAVGMVIDHVTDCFRFGECARMAERTLGFTDMTT